MMCFLTKSREEFLVCVHSFDVFVLVRSQNLQYCFEHVCSVETVLMTVGFLLLTEIDAFFEGSLLI